MDMKKKRVLIGLNLKVCYGDGDGKARYLTRMVDNGSTKDGL